MANNQNNVNENIAVVNIDKNGNVDIKGNEKFETTVTIMEDGTVDVKSEQVPETEESIKIDFKPEEFVNNLGYMGKGMLGIFIVIGAIICSVYLLGLIGKKKNKQ